MSTTREPEPADAVVRPPTPTARVLAYAVATGLAYALLHEGVAGLTSLDESASGTFWPGAGLTLGVLLARPRREWPLLLAAVFLAELLMDAAAGYGWALGALWAAANTLEPLFGATLLTWGARRAPDIGLRRDLVRFVALGVLAGPAVGAVAGSLGGVLISGDPWWPRLPQWFIGDAVGVLVVTPAVLLAASGVWRRPGRREIGALAALLAGALLAMGPWEFGHDVGLPFLVVPAMIAFVALTGPSGAAVGVLAVSALVITVTASGHGQFARADHFHGIVIAQMFLVMMALTSFTMAAMLRALVSRAELEEVSLRARELYQTVAGNLPDTAVGLLNERLEWVVLEGESVLSDLGVTRDAVIGQRLGSTHALSALVWPLAERGLAGETGELEWSSPAGRTFVICVSAVTAPQGDPNVLFVARDVTDQRASENALHQFQKLETVGQLAGGVAHDFNNLLTVIMHSADFALAQLEGHPARAEIEEIQHSAQRATALTRQLLMFGRQEISQPQTVDPTSLIRNVEGLLRRTIGEHIDLEMALDTGGRVIHADANQLEHVLLNLAVNARDAMPDGGVLLLATRVVNLPADPAADVLSGPHVEIAVSDTGVGMSEAVRARALEPFFTTKSAASGTGLGLSTVYGIVKQHHGNLEVESHEGAGTIVRIRLPASADTVAVPAAPTADAHHPTAASGCVLVVEDEESLRRLAVRLLTDSGYEVISASCGQEALGMAPHADVVLTDVVMPGMQGTELAGRLRETQPTLPVIFMSGYTDRPEALPPTAGFITKPFTRTTMVDAVETALAQAVR